MGFNEIKVNLQNLFKESQSFIFYRIVRYEFLGSKEVIEPSWPLIFLFLK